MFESGKILEELIYNLGYPVFNNQWVLYDETLGKDTLYQVKSVSLPNLFPKFETGTLPTGVQYYTSVEFDKEWSFTMEEDTSLSGIKYFADWANSIYSDHQFNLQDGLYVKDFSLALLSPSGITATDIAEISTSRLAEWGVNASKEVLNSALGRLARKASELVSGAITSSGAGLTLLQRTTGRIFDTITDTLQAGISSGLNMLLQERGVHTEDTLLTLSMTGTILKGIEKLDLDYEDGDPIQWKVSLASDTIKATSNGRDLMIT